MDHPQGIFYDREFHDNVTSNFKPLSPFWIGRYNKLMMIMDTLQSSWSWPQKSMIWHDLVITLSSFLTFKFCKNITYFTYMGRCMPLADYWLRTKNANWLLIWYPKIYRLLISTDYLIYWPEHKVTDFCSKFTLTLKNSIGFWQFYLLSGLLTGLVKN